MFAGFFTNRDSIPDWIAWMEYLSPMKYYYEIVITNEYEGQGFDPNPVDYYFNFEMGVKMSFIILIIMTITLRVLGFFALKVLLKTLEWLINVLILNNLILFMKIIWSNFNNKN